MRTVAVPFSIPPRLLRALYDLRGACNSLIPAWHSRPEESRFAATQRSYRWLRDQYPHLAAGWAVTMANETSATLNCWDRLLRRWRRFDPEKWAKCRHQLPDDDASRRVSTVLCTV